MTPSTPHTLFLSLVLLAFLPLLHNASPSPLNATTGFSLELVHRDSIHSPLYNRNLTKAERVQRLVNVTQAHLPRLESYSLGVHPKDVGITPPVDFVNFFIYSVHLGIGHPSPTNLFLLLDTGSDLTWTQGDNCRVCFRQNPPIFSPSDSSTYYPLQCGGRPCRYERKYGFGNGPITRGTLAKEDFTLRSSTGGTFVIPGIVFGCSDENTPTMFRKANGRIGGILGMGYGGNSLVSQLGSRIHYRFSYCLRRPGNSYLRFGNDIRERHPQQNTPLQRLDRRNQYYLNLEGISLNGHRLNLHPSIFTSQTFIDSGVPFSLLIPAAHGQVIQCLTYYFEHMHHLQRADGSQYHLDICYAKPVNGFSAYPSMTLHFQGGADLQLGKQQLFLGDNQMFCLTMLKSSTVTVLGAAQQVGFQFIHDIQAQQLRFAPMDCTQH